MTPKPEIDSEFAAEIERRTTILPDGRKIVRLGDILSRHLTPDEEGKDWVAKTLAELRRECVRHFDEQWPEIPDALPEN